MLALATSACGGDERSGSRSSGAAAPRGFVATLKRDVRPLPGARIAWTTRWRLCWHASSSARRYELQALTGEGASPRLLSQRGRCFELEVAGGENRRSQGYRLERSQLVQSSSLLAYRVRAVLGGGRVSAWSQPFAAGERTPVS